MSWAAWFQQLVAKLGYQPKVHIKGSKISFRAKIVSHEHYLTRMHSSRMRTIRNSSHLPGVSAPKGGCLLPGGLPGLGVPGPGGSAPGGLVWGGLVLGGCLLWGGLLWGCGIPTYTEADPPVNRMTDRCKNITFATSLRTVTTSVTIILTKTGSEFKSFHFKAGLLEMPFVLTWLGY